jgi:hypothetical protein
MAQVLEDSRGQVMIAVDPHKASWTAAAVDASLQLLAGSPSRSGRSSYSWPPVE